MAILIGWLWHEKTRVANNGLCLFVVRFHIKVTREDATVTAYITTENELDEAIAILRLAKQKYHKYD